MENQVSLKIRLMAHACICVFMCCLFLTFVVPISADCGAIRDRFDDAVEYWHFPKAEKPESRFLKFFQKIYNIVVTNPREAGFYRSIAFLVGVSEYEYLSPNLPSVHNDLNQMRDYLLGNGGFDEVYIARDEIVTRDLIEKYVKCELPKRMNKSDRLLFYYSGHGADSGGRTGYMQFRKARKNEFYGNNVLPVSNVMDWSAEANISHMLFVLDACASGLGIVQKGGDFHEVIAELSGKSSRTVLTAGTAGESTFALEGRELYGMSVFTKAFLCCVNSSPAISNKPGLLTTNEIFACIEHEMAKFRATYKKSTTPRKWNIDEFTHGGTFVFINPQTTRQESTTQTEKDRIGLVLQKTKTGEPRPVAPLDLPTLPPIPGALP